jgi:hypothetical protein
MLNDVASSSDDTSNISCEYPLEAITGMGGTHLRLVNSSFWAVITGGILLSDNITMRYAWAEVQTRLTAFGDVGIRDGFRFGTLTVNPAYEVNKQVASVGAVVWLTSGADNEYFFELSANMQWCRVLDTIEWGCAYPAVLERYVPCDDWLDQTPNTTASGSISAGVAVLTPASMVGMSVGSSLFVVGSSGYTAVPLITFDNSGTTGSGAAATAILTGGAVTSATITSGGSGYDIPPLISFDSSFCGGSAYGTANIDIDTGEVISITILSDGTVASSEMTSITALGTLAAATAHLTLGAVSSVTIDLGGSGFAFAPLVSIVGGGGSGATASAVLTGDVLTSITVLAGGTGYTSVPDVVIGVPTGSTTVITTTLGSCYTGTIVLWVNAVWVDFVNGYMPSLTEHYLCRQESTAPDGARVFANELTSMSGFTGDITVVTSVSCDPVTGEQSVDTSTWTFQDGSLESMT